MRYKCPPGTFPHKNLAADGVSESAGLFSAAHRFPYSARPGCSNMYNMAADARTMVVSDGRGRDGENPII